MARMYPSRLPEEVRDDPKRAAEARVFDLFERSLDDEWRVFYSVAWVLPKSKGGAMDGEADFVVSHPDQGFLVCEVKGGIVRRNGQTGQWTSEDPSGAVHEIKDPFLQSHNGKHQILAKLWEHPDWGARRVDSGQLVILPDSASANVPLAPNAPPEIVLFGPDCNRFGDRVKEVFAYWRDQKRVPALGIEGIELLTGVLARSFELANPLGIEFAHADREILHLTEEQFRVLDLLSRARRVAVSGAAGTGKTVLAMEKARRMAADGARTLFTCYNRPLADFLRSSAGGVDRLDIRTFHQLAYHVARQAGVPVADPESRDSGPEYWERTLPEALAAAVRNRGALYDAIVVDEGQDFCDSWWGPLAACLTDSTGGVLYVFYDDNQAIYRTPSAFPSGLVPVALTENLRNTKSIHALASRFYRSAAAVRSLGPEGRAVEVATVSRQDEIEKEVGRILLRLIREDGVSQDRIAVLSGLARPRSALGRGGKIGTISVTNDPIAEPGKVLLDTIHRFKGLERPVVVLAELEPLAGRDATELVYVGTTRARVHLVLVALAETLDRLQLAP
ncbi:MAG: ATP-binding domain-containing protein [Planctomycetes bacterium]|nr:ATP-binding domain-containing protein [Planctomycetota bacterium]